MDHGPWTMTSFYQSSYYFWVITRAILTLLYIFSLLTIFFEADLKHQYELIINLLSAVYTIGLAILSFQEILKKQQPSWLRIAVGVFSVLLALGLTIVILFIGSKSRGSGLLLIFPVWILLLGIFDLMMVERREVVDDIYLDDRP